MFSKGHLNKLIQFVTNIAVENGADLNSGKLFTGFKTNSSSVSSYAVNKRKRNNLNEDEYEEEDDPENYDEDDEDQFDENEEHMDDEMNEEDEENNNQNSNNNNDYTSSSNNTSKDEKDDYRLKNKTNNENLIRFDACWCRRAVLCCGK